ncbi:MAG: hypothetical protein U1E06_19135 [Tabrizicola sp.]|uniref:hypothetical protein n=1 Tax=Tabrizicola sp. TaxID=2005166 RepID=UPI00273634C6|nr:hypothetical protein [Tabrizicola sp.]MDP3261511.1 hypothetical protein [Tabrizicola sp.]MDP3649300.1 hypothetical protein [Paracoccaceae bacterium]MDZ4068922.1 hypothetical protein [Tabrizicola sp.]
MKRRQFLGLIGAAAAVAAAGPALAEDLVENILAQLKRQGYREIAASRTLLGRVRIVAKRRNGVREIILNPNNGEILRDLWLTEDGGKDAKIVGDRHESDDDDDDDDDDDGSDDSDNDSSGNDGSDD